MSDFAQRNGHIHVLLTRGEFPCSFAFLVSGMALSLPEPMALRGRTRKFECSRAPLSPKFKRFNPWNYTLTDVMDITVSPCEKDVISRS